MNDEFQVVPRPPLIVSRYQAKLEGRHRVRIPLDYLPTSDEGREKMLASVPPADGDLAVLGPNHGRGLLAYTTESHLRVWVWMTMLPEGQSPDSEAVIYGTPRFETVNAEIYGTSPKSAKQRWRGRFDSIADQPGLFELRVPKGLTHAAIDLMHDSKSGFTQGLSGTC